MNTYSPNQTRINKIVSLYCSNLKAKQEQFITSKYRSFIDNTCIIFDITATKSLNKRGDQNPLRILRKNIGLIDFFRLFSNKKLFHNNFVCLSSLYDNERYTQCVKLKNMVTLFYDKNNQPNEYALKFVSIGIR
jgi:hypothetical protein